MESFLQPVFQGMPPGRTRCRRKKRTAPNTRRRVLRVVFRRVVLQVRCRFPFQGSPSIARCPADNILLEGAGEAVRTDSEFHAE